MKKIILLRHGESVWNMENRFTGWTDVDLSEKGVEDSKKVGLLLKENGFSFDIAYTSFLKRSIKTLWLVLEAMDLAWIPEIKTWHLNERHYGALQGLNKDEITRQYGKEQVQKWRRYLYELPPPLDKNDPRFPGFDRKYTDLQKKDLPLSENLKQTMERTIDFWHRFIEKDIAEGKNVLLVAHNNTIRALIQHTENLSEEETIKLDIEMAVPLIYEFENDFHRPLTRYYFR